MNTRERIKHHRWQIEQKRKHKSYQVHKNTTYKNAQGGLSEKLIMPSMLDIYDDNSYETMIIIQRLEKHQDSLHQTLILDFRATQNIKAAALVVLFAILDKLVTDYGKKVKLIYSEDFKINRIIRQSGIIHLCNKGVVLNDFNGEQLPIISSTGGKYRDDIVDFLVKKIYKDMTPALENIYADAIQEAINNVTAHAYLNFDEHIKKKWWLLCRVFDNQLYLVLYDAGIGIPSSFEVNMDFSGLDTTQECVLLDLQKIYQQQYDWIYDKFPTFEHYVNAVNLHKQQNPQDMQPLPDSHKIYLAMHGDMTRKKGKDELKHGQGSKSIKALVGNNDEGVLWIFSGFGKMKFKSEQETPALTDLPSKLTGTLIQWNIKVES